MGEQGPKCYAFSTTFFTAGGVREAAVALAAPAACCICVDRTASADAGYIQLVLECCRELQRQSHAAGAAAGSRALCRCVPCERNATLGVEAPPQLALQVYAGATFASRSLACMPP